MADQCIVCLGDLADHERPASQAVLPPSNHDVVKVEDDGDATKVYPLDALQPDNEIVAHLLPCGHDLHNACLKPWVERANSCPICRTNFSLVELSNYVKGPVIDTYHVQDKRQAAVEEEAPVPEDDDTGMGELFGEADTPCIVCQNSDHEESLLLCDGCNQACHVACAGLDGVPAGAWFCYDCMTDPHILQNAIHSSAQETMGTRRGRTVATRRRPHRRSDRRERARSREWAEVWSRIERRTGIDLDFPFDDDSEDPMHEMTRLLTRERDRRWQRRADVATRQGAGARFLEAAPTILQESRPRRVAPQPESQEELRAWNSFDKSRQLRDADDIASSRAGGNRRKRKSRTTSPEATEQPQPQLKRPRTRRVQDQHGESSSTGGRTAGPSAMPVAQRPAPRLRNARNSNTSRPTFLSSLLEEVATSPNAASPSDAGSPSAVEYHNLPFDRTFSPRPSSPELSPDSSAHATPRSMTPVGPTSPRPNSPTLTSMISPVFPPAPAFSPFSPVVEDSVERARSRLPMVRDQGSRRQSAGNTKQSPDRTPEQSPARSALSYSTKLEIQRMVKNVLRPLYADQKITKEQYTDINKKVSRMLYDKVSEYKGGLEDVDNRREWQRLAEDEVMEAVDEIGKSGPAPSDVPSRPPSRPFRSPRTDARLVVVAPATPVEIGQEA